MRINQYFVLVILTLNIMTGLAQNEVKLNRNELENKAKKELIEIAFSILHQQQPKTIINIEDYEISAWKNNTEVLVKFRRIIRYIPLEVLTDKQLEFDITVHLINQEIFPFEDINTHFYILTRKDREALLFIKEKFGPFSASFENTIREGKEDYFIDCENQYSYGRYTVNKKTGQIGPALQGSYLPVPFIANSTEDLNVLTEIKE